MSLSFISSNITAGRVLTIIHLEKRYNSLVYFLDMSPLMLDIGDFLFSLGGEGADFVDLSLGGAFKTRIIEFFGLGVTKLSDVNNLNEKKFRSFFYKGLSSHQHGVLFRSGQG